MNPDELCINVPSIRIDMGDHHVEYRKGDSVAGIPAGTLDSLVRQGLVVPREMIEPEEEIELDSVEAEPVIEESQPVAGDGLEADQGPSWIDTPVSALDLSPSVESALCNAGLLTVRNILDYGRNDTNHTLTSIKRIGKSAEEAIQAAIEKVAD